MKLSWKEYEDYYTAQHSRDCLYVFRRGNTPLYIGRAKRFGGAKGRYAYGYRYLVEALLESGCRLYVAALDSEAIEQIVDCERSLIKKYRRYLVNKRTPEPRTEIKGLCLPWKVRGDVPRQGHTKK